MSKTVHFYHGCPWADGSIQLADTNQQYSWDNVTCGHCWNNKNPDGSSRNWKKIDRERFDAHLEYVAGNA